MKYLCNLVYSRIKCRKAVAVFVAFLALLANNGDAWGQGILFPSLGPVNRSMGGAGTATPIDAIGVTYWNPAAMADMPTSQLSAGADLVFPILSTDSSIAGLAAGSDDGEPGVVILPQIGWVHKTVNPRVTLGLSIAVVGGAKTNYPSSRTNPLFMPQSNTPGAPGGLGRVDTSAQFMQIMPSASYAVNEYWSVGVGPTLTLGQVIVDPFLFAPPDDADGSGQPRYSRGAGSNIHWGGGFQVSSYYRPNPVFSFGSMFRSPQWMETFDAKGEDENGFPRNLKKSIDLPLLVSVGAAYHGIPCTVIAVDARYINYASADGFGDSGFDQLGALRGLGFGDSYSIGLGLQRRISDRFTLRLGYAFNSNPLSDTEAMIGMAAPLFYQDIYSVGGAIHLTPTTDLNFGYNYSPENELTGPILTPQGPVPGSSMTTRVAFHAATLGVSVRY